VSLHLFLRDGPRYHGRPLGDWLQSLAPSDSLGSITPAEATNAIRALGPRAIPRLLTLLQFRANPNSARDRVQSWMDNHPALSQYLPDLPDPQIPDWPNLAVGGFQALGPAAKPAIPKLLAIGSAPQFSLYASECLCAIGPDAVPALTNLFTQPSRQIFVLRTLGMLGLVATNAEPLVASAAYNADQVVADTAILALGEMGEAAAPEIPHLQEMLLQTSHSASAAYALARLGKLEPLILALTNKSANIRFTAANALSPNVRFDSGGRAASALFNGELPNSVFGVNAVARFARNEFASRRIVSLLLTNLDDPDATVRALICRQLGDFRARSWRAIPALTKTLADTNALVRESAAAALEKIDVQLDRGAVIRGPRSQKKIALEFAGHDFAEGGAVILRELARHNARASFFLGGDFLDNPEFHSLAERIISEGHYAGPNGDKPLKDDPANNEVKLILPHSAFLDDLNQNMGKLASFPIQSPRFRPRYFLPPGEFFNQDIVDWSREARFSVVSFTPGTRSLDDITEEKNTNFVSSQAIYDSIISAEQNDPHGLNGYLLLFHLGAGPGRADKFSDHHFGQLLDYLSSRGYEFVGIDELLDPRDSIR
jgi:peptidoglycan/xylan/chitin deacetylase (PgdA/CDA1 family)